MMNRFGRWRPVFEMLAIGVTGAFVYVLGMHFLLMDTSVFIYKPIELYLCFLLPALLLMAILVLVERRNKDIVGNTFLILTSVKMVYAYILLRPVLEQGIKSEKINFFFIFALFLSFETVVSSRMLNRA